MDHIKCLEVGYLVTQKSKLTVATVKRTETADGTGRQT